jgi:hypothetical protein
MEQQSPTWSRRLVRLTSTALIPAALAACEPGGIGDPCIPEDEYNQHFGGFSLGEINIESASFQCASRLCLVNEFQGRVSCPYGQRQADLELPGTAPERCRVPGTTGEHAGDTVEVPVRAWNVERPPSAAVYCSCRCDGPDPDADYCRCPSGFSCEELVPDYGLPDGEQLIGSYCVKAGQAGFEPPTPADCRTHPRSATCPEPRRNP